MKERVRDLIGQGDTLFGRRSGIVSLWQDISENFYPTRADFTRHDPYGYTEGRYWMDGLMTGSPILAHRELSDQFAAMLRPKGKDWFGMTVEDERVAQDSTVKAWFQGKASTMRRIMYDTQAGFTRATKEGDQDFAAFGQCVLSVELNATANGLLFRCWHLRDCAWAEDANRKIDTMHRKWQLPARAVLKLWPDKVDAKLRDRAQKDPNALVRLRHIVLPADEYDFVNPRPKAQTAKFPFVGIYIDCDHDTVLEETPLRRSPYIVPRWVTVSGSAYAHSPATVVGLADARLLQRMTFTLLEAAEKAVNPPMVAVGNQIQGGLNVYPGGVTWVDADYDERKGEALRVLDAVSQKTGIQFGISMAQNAEMMIKRAFYLDQIRLPPAGEAMTATEVRMRTEEYIRAALPLFEPMEMDYNGAICEEVFNLALENGAFGNLSDMPRLLAGQEVRFSFESPLQAAAGQQKAVAFQQAGQLLAAAMQIDPMSTVEFDTRKAFRDGLDGLGEPSWIVDDEQAQRVRAQAAQRQKEQQDAQHVAQVAQAGGAVAGAVQQGQAAGLLPAPAQANAVEGAPV